LFAECPRFSRANWRVIEPARVNRDLVPTMKRIQSGTWSTCSFGGLICPKPLTVGLRKTLSARDGGGGEENKGDTGGSSKIHGNDFWSAIKQISPMKTR
jgi:hypothetical protein